jgi:hypothetical protein
VEVVAEEVAVAEAEEAEVEEAHQHQFQLPHHSNRSQWPKM